MKLVLNNTENLKQVLLQLLEENLINQLPNYILILNVFIKMNLFFKNIKLILFNILKLIFIDYY